MATVVRKKPGQSDDRLISDFRKKILEDDVITELKDREFYKKPSFIKQEKIKARRKGRKSSR